MVGINSKSIESDGLSIAPLVKGEKELNREAIFWHFPHYSNHGMQSAGGAIRSGDYKLLEYFDTRKMQLFNLKYDIGEQNDLMATEPDKANELKKLLHNWRESLGAKMMEENPPPRKRIGYKFRSKEQ